LTTLAFIPAEQKGLLMRQCARCILPANYRNITFDTSGVCNYCRTYEKLRPRLEDFNHLGSLFERRIEAARGHAEYDALVGLSGGKDSSYIAYILQRKYGLNVLTVTIDNGFLTDFARDNVRRVTGALGVDHFFYKSDWPMLRHCYRAATYAMGLTCIACAQLGYALLYKLAFDRGIPLVVHGRSRTQMFKELAAGYRDPFIPLIASNLAPQDIRTIKANGSSTLAKMNFFFKRVFKNKRELKQVTREFIIDLERFEHAATVPDMVGFFLYYPYDEEALKRTLEEQIGWKRPSDDTIMSHHDCAIHDAAAYLYNQCLGYPLMAQELSVAIRMEEMTREQALERLQAERCLREYPTASMNVLTKRLGIADTDIGPIIRKARIRHKLLRLFVRAQNLITRPSLEL
jgi:PP-loop superfamily ATP-utilizing enzyme